MPAPPPRSVLALDIGHRRVGLAGCDPLGLSVTPLTAVQRGPFAADLDRFEHLVRHRGVQALVVGVPLDARSLPTPQAGHCRRYAIKLLRGLLGRGLTLPLSWVNEHGSTWAAAERFNLHGDRTGRLDSAAAVLLLEQWLLEGPEPLDLKALQGDPVAPATIASGTPASADPS